MEASPLALAKSTYYSKMVLIILYDFLTVKKMVQ